MKNYTAPLSIDKDGTPLQDAPAPKLAVQRIMSENATASSVITMSQDTTKIEVVTVGTPAILRWVATTDTQASVIGVAGATANYDHVIPPSAKRLFVVPVETGGTYAPSSQVGANVLNGLYKRFAIKTQGIASVYTSEYP